MDILKVIQTNVESVNEGKGNDIMINKNSIIDLENYTKEIMNTIEKMEKR